MKRIYTFIMLLSLSSVTLVGCFGTKNSSKNTGTNIGGTVVKTVATVVGLILLSKLLKNVLNTIGGSTAFDSVSKNKGFMANVNEDTKLNSFANNDFTKTALQLLVADHYQIPLTTVTKNFSSLNTLGDLSTFIGENASARSLSEIK